MEKSADTTSKLSDNLTTGANGEDGSTRLMGVANPLKAVFPTTLSTSGPSTTSNKTLPNIQPKGNAIVSNSQRQIIPKIDGQAGATPVPVTGQNNVIIPQGIQHVLINGQLYPIIQTANGTHLLIQQPVGQVQPAGGKQVFTAQPIQLGGVHAAPQQNQQQNALPVPLQSGAVTTQGAQQHQGQITAQPQQHGQLIGGPTSLPLSQNQPLMPNNFINQPVQTSLQNMLQTPVTSSVNQTQSQASFAAQISGASSQPLQSHGITSAAAVTNSAAVNNQQPQPVPLPHTTPSLAASGNVQVQVSPQTQQLLSKINEQIEILKRKPDLDEQGKKALASLMQAQQHVMNNVRNHLQMYSQRPPPGAAVLRPANQQYLMPGVNSVPAPLRPPGPPMASGSPAMMQASHMLQQGVAQLNTDTSKKIVETAQSGNSVVNNKNIANVIAAFSNVKIGGQIYNIQLMENQKKEFVETMSKLTAPQQHEFVIQQTNVILQNVFHRQQQQQLAVSSAPSPQTSAVPAVPARQPTPSRSRSARGGKKRPSSRGGSAAVASSAPMMQPVAQVRPTIPQGPLPTQASPLNNKVIRPPQPQAKKSKVPLFSSKRVADKLLGQIQKDQEILVRPDYYKKPFLSARQVKERLLRYHLYHKAEPHKAYRVLHEENLYATTAHDKVLDKEVLLDRFRPYLWEESISLSDQTEDLLIAKLLLDDEKECIGSDQLLEQQDIELFKSMYTKPEKEPTPPPSPSPEPSPVPSPQPSPNKTAELMQDLSSPEKSTNTVSPPADTPTYLQHKQQILAEPEPDIIKRVKRETAREARERRAAKRRTALATSIQTELPVELHASKRRRRKSGKLERSPSPPSRIAPEPLENNETESDVENFEAYSEEKENNGGEDEHESPTIEITQGDVTLKFDYESSSPYSFLKQHDDTEGSECEETAHRQHVQTVREDDNKESAQSGDNTDSEDELIDIGSPPTPPITNTEPYNPSTPELPPTPILDMDTPSLLSPPKISSVLSSSPKKISSIYGNSADPEQSHGDLSFDRRKSLNMKTPELPINNSGNSLNDSNISDDEDMDVDVLNDSNVPNDDSITQREDNSYHSSPNEQNGTFNSHLGEGNESNDHYESQRQSVDDTHPSQGDNSLVWQQSLDAGQTGNHSEYDNSTDEEDRTADVEMHDAAVSGRSPSGSEADVRSSISAESPDSPSAGEGYSPSAGEGDSPSAGEGDYANEDTDVDIESDREANESPEKPALSLRINKNRLGSFVWPGENEPSHPEVNSAIKLKITDPIPPPIKLRIKRDINDKWEAASSVSSYNSNEENSEDEADQPENGGVAVNWDDNTVDAVSEVDSDQEYTEEGGNTGQYAHHTDHRDISDSEDEGDGEGEWSRHDSSYQSNPAVSQSNIDDEDSNTGYNIEGYGSDADEAEGDEGEGDEAEGDEGEGVESEDDDAEGDDAENMNGQLAWDAHSYVQPSNEDSVPFASYSSYPSIPSAQNDDDDYEYDD